MPNDVKEKDGGCDRPEKDCGNCASESCGERQGSGAHEEGGDNQEMLNFRMSRIKHKIIVLSGKGGVGKSTVAVNLAAALSMEGKKVGLLDVDIHGPSIPVMLGLTDEPVQSTGQALLPVALGSLRIMSIGFLLQEPDDPIIWRGPMKMTVIRQFLQDVEWGELDYLIVDSPPGTGDEPLSVCQLIGDPDGAVLVTTPQKVAAADVRKSVNFCRQINLPVLGVVENMSGFACPHCGTITPVFKSDGGASLAEDFGIPFLGPIPLDPAIGAACDDGVPFIRSYAGSATAEAFRRIVEPLLKLKDKRRNV